METPETPRHSDHHSISRTITPLSGVPAVRHMATLRFPLLQPQIEQVVNDALNEDGAYDDITTIATIVSDRRSRGTLVARQKGVVAGVPLALEAFRLLDATASIRVEHEDGARVKQGEPILSVTGHARGLLSAERVALNFCQRLSGIATLTRTYVDLVSGTGAKIIDTRKTTPGWRALEKYAVRAGGGANYRMNLSDAVLIKDNHLAAVGGDVGQAVGSARELAPLAMKIEVECDNLEQVEAAVAASADIILLDNMTTDQLRDAVKLVSGRAILEASGGVSLNTVRAIAETGVDWISIGALTHSAPALDLGLDFD